MTEKHKQAISKGRRKMLRRKKMSEAMKASWARRREPEKLINDERIRTTRVFDLVLENQLHKATISALVRLVDELRQPYNNSKRHDLYLMATNKLNDLEDRGLTRWD